MTCCDRCKREDGMKINVTKVCLELVDDGDVSPIVPEMELCKRCRAVLRMNVLAFLEGKGAGRD